MGVADAPGFCTGVLVAAAASVAGASGSISGASSPQSTSAAGASSPQAASATSAATVTTMLPTTRNINTTPHTRKDTPRQTTPPEDPLKCMSSPCMFTGSPEVALVRLELPRNKLPALQFREYGQAAVRNRERRMSSDSW